MKGSDQLLAFYKGEAPDHRGRYLREVLAWDDDDLETTHDYIQWLFPTFERSAFQPEVPILTSKTAAVFRSDPKLQNAIQTSFDRLLRFYGLQIDRSDGIKVTAAQNFSKRTKEWLTPGNHNHLRITRILKSLTALGLGKDAQALLLFLNQLYEGSSAVRDVVSPRTLQFWRSSVSVG